MEEMEEETVSAYKVAKKLNVLQAMQMLSSSWKNVKVHTIFDCWEKDEFGDRDVEDDEAAIPIPKDVPEDEAEGFLK